MTSSRPRVGDQIETAERYVVPDLWIVEIDNSDRPIVPSRVGPFDGRDAAEEWAKRSIRTGSWNVARLTASDTTVNFDQPRTPEPTPVRHFAPYGSTNAVCDETVPQRIRWDVKRGEYADPRFTVRRALTTCQDCRFRDGITSDELASGTPEPVPCEFCLKRPATGITEGDLYSICDDCSLPAPATVDDVLAILDEMNEDSAIAYEDYERLHDAVSMIVLPERATAAHRWDLDTCEVETWDELTADEQENVIEDCMARDSAEAVLALLPGRSEAEVKAEVWDEGRRAEQEYRTRQDDADAAGQYVQINLPRNPYRGTAPCGCDLTGMTPPAVHIVDGHPDPTGGQ